MLLADQSSDGSWNDDPLATINRLFGLHLTQRSRTRQINIALDWLLDGIEITVAEMLSNRRLIVKTSSMMPVFGTKNMQA